MKKLLTILAVILVCIFCVSARNGQEVIPLSSGLYDAMDALFIMEGKAMPSSVRPWTVTEADKYFSQISGNAASGLYQYVAGILGRKPLFSLDGVAGITLGLTSNVNVYYHTDTSFEFPFNDVDNYLFRINPDNDKSIVRGKIEAYFGDLFYLYFSLNYRNADWINGIAFDSYNFNFDFSMFTPEGYTSEQDLMVPDRAFISMGGPFWNIQLGRDRFKTGFGKSGNLVLSDNFPFHNLLRLNLFGSWLKFSFAVSSFWHTDLYDRIPDDVDGLYLFVTNRIEGSFFSGKLYFAFNNSMMFKNDNGVMNLRYINPVDFFHNYFVPLEQNSSSAFEAAYGFAKGWNVYAQLILDDLATPSEGKGEGGAPDQVGFLLGLRHSFALGKGFMTLNLEAVYTFPYLYLRSTDRGDQKDDDHGLSYIGIVRGMKGELECRRYFVGYTYGGDAAVLDLGSEYTVPDDITLRAELLFMLHGEKNFASKYRLGDHSYWLSGNISQYGFLELYARKELTGYLGVYGQYDLVYGKGKWDNQFVIGAGLSL